MNKNLLSICTVAAASLTAAAQVSNPFVTNNALQPAVAFDAPVAGSVALADDDTPITAQPEGTLVSVERQSGAYYMSSGQQTAREVFGQATSLVEAADGSVYILNPITARTTNSWVKAEKGEGDTVVVKCPALVQVQTNPFTGVKTQFYLSQVNSKPGSTGSLEFSIADQKDVKYTYKDGVLTYCNPADYSMSLGLVQTTDSGETYTWTGYGDGYSILKPVTATPNALPEGLETELYTMTYGGYKTYVQGAIQDGKVYLNNLPSLPASATIVGTIGDNTVTFADGQYLGVISGYHAFLKGFQIDYDETGDPVGSALTNADIVMDYDAANTAFSTSGNMLINSGSGTQNISYITYYQYPAFKRFVEVAGTPADPDFDINIGAYTAYDPDFGFGMIRFHLPTVDTEGNDLLADKTFYNMFIDGKVYEFTTDVYYGLTENLVDVPFGFTDDYWDIYSDGKGYNAVALYMQPDPQTIGIQAIYRGGGEEHKSNIVTYIVSQSAVNDVTVKDVKSVDYVDLQGRKVAQPTSGIYVKTVTYTDGTRRSTKIVK